ncbi:MAG: hypothetical protein IT372_15560 [Polyangiaceae bacterium]|nr:hypothetical protein [Polyangiaceae bacterium]
MFTVLALLPFACVPEGPATGDAGAPAARTAAAPPSRPRPAPAASEGPAASAAQPAPAPPITEAFEDSFDRVELGPDWSALSPKWRIAGGRLCARGARNRGVWLRRALPENAIVEFDAIAESEEGDLKAELWGDGKSGATSTSYTNATSYLVILGGWKNKKHVLARLDEHGEDRLELDVDPESDDERARAVEPGQPYRFKIERADGRTLTWSVNEARYFELPDTEPLTGPGHEHLGFNDWDAPVCFDNVRVTPL